MIPVSPFLHREERPAAPRLRFQVYGHDAQLDRALRDAMKAKYTLERLRYKWWVAQGTLGSFMQRLGDIGRRLFPHLDPKNRIGRRMWF